MMQPFFLIPLDQWLCLGVINDQAFLNCLLVVISATTVLTAFDKTGHQLVLGNIQLNHRCHFVTTFIQHFLQCLSLWDRTGKPVKDNTLMTTTKRVVDIGKDADH